MARDYKSFPRECDRLFGPIAERRGFSPIGGATYERPVDGFSQVVFFQLSRTSDSTFSATVGLHVPGVGGLGSGSEPRVGVCVSHRLTDKGIQGSDCWLSAGTKAELQQSLEMFAGYLATAEPWLSQFQDLSDVADEYGRNRFRASDVSSLTGQDGYGVACFGTILALAGRNDEARFWLATASELIHRPQYGMRGKKMIVDPMSEEDRDVLKRVQKSLDELSS